METIGAAERATPLIAVARADNGDAVALLPLARRRIGPLRVASFQGGRMANYRMGLFREPERWTRAEIEALLREVARKASLDLFAFVQQPFAWRGKANPMRELGGDPSPSFGYATHLGADPAAWLAAHYSADARKKRRSKTRKLLAFGPVAFRRAETSEEKRLAFAALLAQKRARFSALKQPNEFDHPAVEAFLARLAGGAAGFEWFVATAGERVVSVLGGFASERQFSGLVLSHDASAEIAPTSPGEWLVQAMAAQCAARGFDTLDFGVGEARYKAEACEIVVAQFDTAFAATWRGHLGAVLFRCGRRLKRRIKQSPRLFDAARRIQRFLVTPRVR